MRGGRRPALCEHRSAIDAHRTAEDPPRECDLVVVGAGIVGLTAARELARRHPEARIAVLEREARIGAHQTTHSSGVVHAGIAVREGGLASLAELRRYVPELELADVGRGFAGVRGQALARDGTLVDDFVISRTERAVHVRNAPSPAATSALALARTIADQVEPELSR